MPLPAEFLQEGVPVIINGARTTLASVFNDEHLPLPTWTGPNRIHQNQSLEKIYSKFFFRNFSDRSFASLAASAS